MAQFIPPNYNLIRYEIGIAKEYPIKNYDQFSIFYRLNKKYQQHEYPQLFSWYESLTEQQLEDVDLYISKMQLSSMSIQKVIKLMYGRTSASLLLKLIHPDGRCVYKNEYRY